MKKAILIPTGLILAIFMAACSAGAGQKANAPKNTPANEQTSEVTPASTKTTLPVYTYKEADSTMAAAAEYTVSEFSKNYDVADVSVPAVTIVGEDMNDPSDVKVWGIFELYNYKLNEKNSTLECQSGGVYPGLMHMEKKDGGGYTVKSVELVEDGEGFTQSAKKIFGNHYDRFMKEYSNDKDRDDTRKDFIEDYVKSNNLPITHYQDFGWDPIALDLK